MNKTLVKHSQELIAKNNAKTLEQLLIRGDLSSLSEEHRLHYVERLCKIMGISILTRPFDFIKTKSGAILLYANRSCAEQLRKKHRISIKIVAREKVGDLYVVTANAIDNKKREDSAIGATSLAGLRGEDLANAMMKAETKAKRRVTLSLCGLGMLDELESRQVAEQESKEAAEVAVTQVEEKVQDSKERPEFESVQTPASDPEPGSTQPEATTIGDYILRAGKIKGKTLKDVPLSKLAQWLDWYNEKVENGTHGNLSEGVHTDAKAINQFLLESSFPKTEDKDERADQNTPS